jgi:hypothetical protein
MSLSEIGHKLALSLFGRARRRSKKHFHHASRRVRPAAAAAFAKRTANG